MRIERRTMPSLLRHVTRPLITLLAIGAGSALVACGGGEDTADAEANFEDAQLEFAQCMRENGIDMPDPEPSEGEGEIRIGLPDGVDPNSEAVENAREECEPLIRDAIPEGERPDPAEMRDRAHKMTECLRDKGYDVPEPQIVTPGSGPTESQQSGGGESGGSSSRGFPQELERLQDDPEFQQAQEDCAEEADLPGPVLSPGGPGGPDSED
jgi:hypothetical protein